MKAFLTGGVTSPSASVSTYGAPSHNLAAGGTAAGFRAPPAPSPYTARRFYVVLAAAPGAGTSYTARILKNGFATGHVITISDAATLGSSSVPVAFARGDTIEVQLTPAGTPSVPATVKWYIEVEAPRYFPVFSSANGTQPTATSYFGAAGVSAAYDSTESNAAQVVPIAGRLSNFQAALSGTGTIGKSLTYNLFLNGVQTAVTITVADNALSGEDRAHQITVSPGDRLSWQYVPSDATPPTRTPRIGFRFEPTTDGQSCLMFGNSSAQSTTATNYNLVEAGGSTTWAATESNRSTPVPDGYTFTALYVRAATAPGASKQYTLALRNAGATSALSTVLSGTNTTASTTGASVTPADRALVAASSVPSGTPAATGGTHFGLAITGPTTPATANRGVPLGVL